MCDPMTAAAIGSTIFSAVGQMAQANNEAKAMTAAAANNQKIAEYNAKVDEQNAAFQRQAGVDAQNRGANDAAVMRENYLKANATLRANAAGAGLIADSGTFGDLQDQNTTSGELNALTVSNNAERDAWGYNVQATDFMNKATGERFGGQVGVNNAKYQASVTRANGAIGAFSTLVTGASKAYGQFGGSTPQSAGEQNLVARARATSVGSGAKYYNGY